MLEESPIPAIYVPSGVTDAVIAAGATLTVEWRWPSAFFVEAILLAPRALALATLEADLASLRLRIVDETADDIISDARATVAGFFASGVALHGRRPVLETGDFPYLRPLPIQRPVVGGDLWQISIENVSGVDQRPYLHFVVGRPYQ